MGIPLYIGLSLKSHKPATEPIIGLVGGRGKTMFTSYHHRFSVIFLQPAIFYPQKWLNAKLSTNMKRSRTFLDQDGAHIYWTTTTTNKGKPLSLICKKKNISMFQSFRSSALFQHAPLKHQEGIPLSCSKLHKHKFDMPENQEKSRPSDKVPSMLKQWLLHPRKYLKKKKKSIRQRNFFIEHCPTDLIKNVGSRKYQTERLNQRPPTVSGHSRMQADLKEVYWRQGTPEVTGVKAAISLGTKKTTNSSCIFCLLDCIANTCLCGLACGWYVDRWVK